MDYIVAPFISKGNQWFSYDDIHAIQVKSQYIMDQGFAGGFIWSIETDDFKNLCGDGEYPLLHTIQDVLNGGFQTPPPGWTTPIPEVTSAGGPTAPPLPPDNEYCNANTVGPQPHPEDCGKSLSKLVPYANGQDGDQVGVVVLQAGEPIEGTLAPVLLQVVVWIQAP